MRSKSYFRQKSILWRQGEDHSSSAPSSPSSLPDSHGTNMNQIDSGAPFSSISSLLSPQSSNSSNVQRNGWLWKLSISTTGYYANWKKRYFELVIEGGSKVLKYY